MSDGVVPFVDGQQNLPARRQVKRKGNGGITERIPLLRARYRLPSSRNARTANRLQCVLFPPAMKKWAESVEDEDHLGDFLPQARVR